MLTDQSDVLTTGNIQELPRVLKFEVVDTGVGMSREDLNQLFQLFGKLKKTYHINQQGVGLGLMISKQLCNKLGGDIFVDSEPGKGTKFTFKISPREIRETTILPTVRNLNFKATRSLREIR